MTSVVKLFWILTKHKNGESKESSGGLAFDVILKPALLHNPPPVLMRTHSPNKEFSQEDINKKLKEAEDRRLAMESQKLLSVQRSRERAAEASQRIQDLNDSFRRDAEKRLLEKMEVSMEKKTTQIRQLQDRLREHAQRVELIKKMGEESRVELKERIDKKLETAGEKRELQLGKVQDRIRQHQKHIEEVIECSSKFSRDTEERIIQKMESSLKNREEHLNNLLEKLKKHAQHAHKIRMKKLNSLNNENSLGLLYDYDSDDEEGRKARQYTHRLKVLGKRGILNRTSDYETNLKIITNGGLLTSSEASFLGERPQFQFDTKDHSSLGMQDHEVALILNSALSNVFLCWENGRYVLPRIRTKPKLVMSIPIQQHFLHHRFVDITIKVTDRKGLRHKIRNQKQPNVSGQKQPNITSQQNLKGKQKKQVPEKKEEHQVPRKFRAHLFLNVDDISPQPGHA